MKILSLYWGLASTASLFIDGEVVASVSEERFTRKKNDDLFPKQSIQYCLDFAGLKPQDLDGVAVASFEASYHMHLYRRFSWTIKDYLQEQKKYWLPVIYHNKSIDYESVITKEADYEQYPQHIWRNSDPDKFDVQREAIVAEHLDIDPSKVIRTEHHTTHAYYSYYASHMRNKKVLAFTVDGYGDGLNATIGIFDENGNYERVYETIECNIARIYRYITLVLGMKPNEHEYKVMGLAPYSKPKYAKEAYDIFASTLCVEGIEFKWKTKPTDSYFWFKERLDGIRFDNIAGGMQMWVEDLLVQWVKNAVAHFGINDIILSGGVAMNIKAMGKIAQLPEVNDIFVGGSASDESLAISSGIYMAHELSTKQGVVWESDKVKAIDPLYLGPKASYEDEQQLINSIDKSLYEIVENPTNTQVAKVLADGKVVARCAGRMEFGQRSLGNRSILADPTHLQVKERINAMIKNRDFWMPFAPVVLDKFTDKYLINPKNLRSPHMTLGFDTTELGYQSMLAACHPADKTARAQILEKKANPALYALLEEFEVQTGRGALLNTSFNLHGYPIVNTPQDAWYVFTNSGLEGLLLNNFLIIKR